MPPIKVLVYCTIREISHGSEMLSTKNMTMIFGTKTTLCSWIWVIAWSRPITSPTISAATNTGEATISVVQGLPGRDQWRIVRPWEG